MMLAIIKFLHLICGVSFFGIIIATFFYISRSIHKKDRSLINYSIKTSYFGDAIILLCILVQIATSIALVLAGHFTLKVPWIFIAYHAFGLLILLWLLTIVIKIVCFSKKTISSYSLKIFYALNISMIIIFIIIIHDAVIKNTGLAFLFRK